MSILGNVFQIQIGQHTERGSANDLDLDHLEKKGNPDKGVVVVLQRFLFTFLFWQERESETRKGKWKYHKDIFYLRNEDPLKGGIGKLESLEDA